LHYNSHTNKALAAVNRGAHTRVGFKPGLEEVQLDMHALKLIRERTLGYFKQALRLPFLFTKNLRLRRQQFVLNAVEAERLDRIRNPSKYLGR